MTIVSPSVGILDNHAPRNSLQPLSPLVCYRTDGGSYSRDMGLKTVNTDADRIWTRQTFEIQEQKSQGTPTCVRSPTYCVARLRSGQITIRIENALQSLRYHPLPFRARLFRAKTPFFARMVRSRNHTT